MPTYEYECAACGHTFEKFQSMKADRVRTCPACGKRRVRRLLGTGGALIFKGSGFYATDYRSASYKEGAKNDKPAADTAKKESSAPAGCAACKEASGGECPKAKKE
jgi:putative FmdB family regulatory protein